MENFAEYMLNEKDLVAKMEIEYYLSKKQDILFDKSVVFKTEIAKLFMDFMEIEVDKNLVLTACLLCNCKKSDSPQELEKIHSYAKEGAEYLKTIGFGRRICKICEEVNRYSKSSPREKESDIVELADQFGGMLLDRVERKGFDSEEAIVLLEYRNLKDKYNRYLETFIAFVKEINEIKLGDKFKIGVFTKLKKIHDSSSDVKEFIKNIAKDFDPVVGREIEKSRKRIKEEIFNETKNPNRALFSAETTKKIMGHILTKEEKFTQNEE